MPPPAPSVGSALVAPSLPLMGLLRCSQSPSLVLYTAKVHPGVALHLRLHSFMDGAYVTVASVVPVTFTPGRQPAGPQQFAVSATLQVEQQLQERDHVTCTIRCTTHS